MTNSRIQMKIHRKSKDCMINIHTTYNIDFLGSDKGFRLETIEKYYQSLDTFLSIEGLINHLVEESLNFKNQVIPYNEMIELTGEIEGTKLDFFTLESKKDNGVIFINSNYYLEKLCTTVNDYSGIKSMNYIFRLNQGDTSDNFRDGYITMSFHGNPLIEQECDRLNEMIELIYKKYKSDTSHGFLYKKIIKLGITWGN